METYAFEGNGSFEIKLIGVCLQDAQELSSTQTIVVSEVETDNVVANFTFNPSTCQVPCTITFNDSSLNATAWNWNFADADSGSENTSTLENPTHTFNATGDYQVTLIASNDQSTDQITKIVKIHIPTYFKIEGASGSEVATSIIETSDGFFTIVGHTNSQEYTGNLGANYLLLWKFDELGGKIWTDPVVQKPNSFGHVLIENSLGEYVVVGEEYNDPSNSGVASPIFTIFNPNGSQKVLRHFENPISELESYGSFSDIIEIGNQYAITGYKDLCGPGCPHILLAYLDVNGNVIEGSKSTDSFTGEDARGISVSRTPINVVSFGHQDGELILRENRTNNMPFNDNRFSEFLGNQTARKILGTPDGDFILLAETDNGTNGGIDIVFFSVNNGLEKIIEPVHIGGAVTDKASSIVEFENDYIIVGSSNSDNSDGSFDIYLVKLNINGNIIWEKKFSRDGSDEFAQDVKVTRDGGLIITGYVEYNDNTKDIFLMKTNRDGEVL